MASTWHGRGGKWVVMMLVGECSGRLFHGIGETREDEGRGGERKRNGRPAGPHHGVRGPAIWGRVEYARVEHSR